MPPPEFVYLDKPRLKQYLEWYVPDPHGVRKRQKREVKFALPLPEASLSQESEARQLTVHEQISLLEENMMKDGCLHNRRPGARWDCMHFVKETVDAYRVFVPQNRIGSEETPAIKFWLSPRTEQTGALCLLEDCRIDDSESMNCSLMSTYTLLQSLIYFNRAAIRKTDLQDIIPNDPAPNPHCQYDKEHPPSLVDEYHNAMPFASDFIFDPIRLLNKWGCRIFSTRRITSLYRVREYGEEATDSKNCVSTFAYPIYIVAS